MCQRESSCFHNLALSVLEPCLSLLHSGLVCYTRRCDGSKGKAGEKAGGTGKTQDKLENQKSTKTLLCPGHGRVEPPRHNTHEHFVDN